MKVKIFSCAGGRNKELETEINEWLGFVSIRVVSLTQSSTDYYYDGSRRETLVIILYEEPNA